MSGPNIQMPSANASFLQIERDEDGNVKSVSLNPAWVAALQLVIQNAYVCTRNGPTAERPTSSTIGRFIGMPYFDTTLGLPVFLDIASTSVWVKADGTVA